MEQQQQQLPPPQSSLTSQDSLRELNRLLESALRIGGKEEGGKSTNSSNGGDGISGESEEGVGEWRLDTARQLCGVSFRVDWVALHTFCIVFDECAGYVIVWWLWCSDISI